MVHKTFADLPKSFCRVDRTLTWRAFTVGYAVEGYYAVKDTVLWQITMF